MQRKASRNRNTTLQQPLLQLLTITYAYAHHCSRAQHQTTATTTAITQSYDQRTPSDLEDEVAFGFTTLRSPDLSHQFHLHRSGWRGGARRTEECHTQFKYVNLFK